VDIPDAARRLERWLLQRPQLAEGPQSGAVVGTDDARSPYAYPEITGYYLTWLDFLSATDPPRPEGTRPAAMRATTWLRAVLTAERPRTRAYLDPARDGDDWRNSAVFAFDVGMVLRGAAAWCAPADPLRDRCADLLGRLRDTDGAWLSARPLPGGGSLPERWSTRPGPHLLKVAGGALAWADPAAERTVADSARATLARYAPGLKASLPTMSHPSLYAMEGLLQAEHAGHTDFQDELVQAYRTLDDGCHGGAPREYVGRPTSRLRTDVLAQTLRIGCVLAGRGLLDGHRADRLPMLADRLAALVAADGGLPFEPGDATANTWCAMFAHQALRYFERFRADGPVPGEWVRRLV
jgi:hypothetical protein